VVYYVMEDSMRNLFDEEEEIVSEYDQLQNQEPIRQERPQQRQQQYQQSAPQPQYVQEQEIAYTLESNEEDILEEAIVRLEQARLYEMLIKHDIFEGVDGNPIALQNVQNELKSYIIDRLQILLGIKADDLAPERYSERTVKVELPFNRLEIEALKDIANKLTKGASGDMQEREVIEAEEEMKPTQPQRLKSLGMSKPKQAPSQAPSQAPRYEAPAAQPAPQRQVKKQGNVTVNKTKKKSESILEQLDKIDTGKLPTSFRGEALKQSEIEEAKRQLAKEIAMGAANKNPYDMTEEELQARAATIQGGQAVSKSANRIPMPDPEVMSGIYAQRVASRQQLSNGNTSNEMLTAILQKVLKE
jgi:hypothetical protein